MNHFIISLMVVFLALQAHGQEKPYATWDNNTLTLNNGAIKRAISIGNKLNTKFMGLATSKSGILAAEDAREFYFELNNTAFDGNSAWRLLGIKPVSDSLEGNGAIVSLVGTTGTAPRVQVDVTYMLYPGLPLIRKKVEIKNLSTKELKLESVDAEILPLSWDPTHSWVISNFARQKRLGSFKGNWDDPAVVVHDIHNNRGILLGNEAPGVTKKTTAFLDGKTVSIGLNHANEDFAFRRWLKPSETWESPWTFVAVYENSVDPREVINGTLADFVRKHMGIRLAAIKEKPTFVYNTWFPFNDNINEKLIKELVDVAADCGIQEFVIDAGWSGGEGDSWTSNLGDWYVDTKKFPNGLKPLFDYIKSKGMKPGLWVSVASASRRSKILKQHPEWFVNDADGKPTNLHNPNDKEMVTACLTTGWYDYIKDVVMKLVKENGLAYVKLDLSVVTSAYIYDNNLTGCKNTNHAGHKDREESYLLIYQKCMQLFDELHKEAPELFIDCTFETAGRLQLIDYALVKHAEGDWLSNFEEPQPISSMRVRNLAWWRSPVIPATSLVIGNLPLNDSQYELIIKSLIGSMPIVLGDLRTIAPADRKIIHNWSDWIRQMQERYDYMMFRQDLLGFGEPTEGCWDGFSRINTDTKKGGIVGVFKQGSAETLRMVTIKGLDPIKNYEINLAPLGINVTKLTGKELVEKGFKVQLTKTYDAAVFEIRETTVQK